MSTRPNPMVGSDGGFPQRGQRPAPPPDSGKRRFLQRVISDTSSPTFRAITRVRASADRAADAWDLAKLYRAKQGARPDHSMSAQTVGVRFRGRPVSATRQQSANVLSVQVDAVRAVCASASAAQVPIFGYLQSSTTVRLATTRAHVPTLLAALCQYSDHIQRPICIAAVESGQLRRLSDIQPSHGRVTRNDAILAIGMPVVDPLEQQVLGVAESIHLEIWDEGVDGVWQAPGPNRWCERLSPAARVPDTFFFHGVEIPSFRSISSRHVADVTFDIDAVITWVDNSDPSWQERWADHAGPKPSWEADESRYRNLDELRYCMRSLRTYAPWIRKIHLVTDQQIPHWFTPDDRVSIVDHRDIWADQTDLPVFNSHAIESRLHHIPGLSSHYLYLNDDLFLGRATAPEDFFTSGGHARLFPSSLHVGVGPPSPGEGFPSIAARNDRALLKEAVGRVQTMKLLHAPIPQVKEVALELEQRFPADYARTARARFRSRTDISPIPLQSWYGYATGTHVASAMTNRYFDLLTDDLRSRLRYLLKHRQVDSFCLNMGETIDQMSKVNIELAQPFLSRYFPFAAEWENVATGRPL